MARRDYQRTQQTIRDMKTGREVKARPHFPQGHSTKINLPVAKPSLKLTDKARTQFEFLSVRDEQPGLFLWI